MRSHWSTAIKLVRTLPRLMCFRRVAPDQLRATAGAAVLIIVLSIIAGALLDYANAGAGHSFSSWGLASAVASWGMGTAVLAFARNETRIFDVGGVVAGIAALSLCFTLLVSGIAALEPFGLLPGPYEWGAYQCRAIQVVTNKTPAGTYRAPGRYEANLARERKIVKEIVHGRSFSLSTSATSAAASRLDENAC